MLTPLTTFRTHPLDTYVLAGNNIMLIVFIHADVLQHAHVWLAFRGVLGRLFISPAHPQVHHSTNPIHFNKNLGSCLAIWDWLFGTLHVPAKTSGSWPPKTSRPDRRGGAIASLR